MRVIYASKKGGKPLRMGMNLAKRIARFQDRREQLLVQQQIGFGLPRQHKHHQELVKQRHAYYGDVYAETQRLRHEASLAASAEADADGVGDADREVSEPPAGPDHQ